MQYLFYCIFNGCSQILFSIVKYFYYINEPSRECFLNKLLKESKGVTLFLINKSKKQNKSNSPH